MKFNKIMFLTIVLLAILSLSAVSAQEDATDINSDDSLAADETNQLNSDNNDNLADSYGQSKYVAIDGDDNAAGNENSPYKTINKAISEVNSSQKSVIYLGEGTFSGENNTDLSINLAHKENGGSLTIIGKGMGKTIIDANYEAPIFKSIGADSVVTLINITFTQGKNSDGAAITNNGNLTIDGCEFKNFEATSSGAIYQTNNNPLTILNSKFANNVGDDGADIYFSSENLITIIGCEFENSTISDYPGTYAASVKIQNGKSVIRKNTFKNMPMSRLTVLMCRWNNDDNIANVTDNTFINCSHNDNYGIIFVQNSYLKGNTFVNCSADNGYIYLNTDFNAYIKFNDATANSTKITLTAKVTDDMGNPVRNTKVQFYVDDKKVGESTAVNGTAIFELPKLYANGIYEISGYSSYSSKNPFELTIENGTLTVNFNQDPVDLWISTEGSDENGTGSKEKPFKSIKHALDIGTQQSPNINLHIMDGTYTGENNTGLVYTEVCKINMIGENYNKVIIDAENERMHFAFAKNCEVAMKNITLVNGKNEYRSDMGYNSASLFGSIISFTDCIIKDSANYHCSVSEAGYTSFYANNLKVINCKQFWVQDAEIYNSLFCNSTGNFMGAVRLVSASGTKFINRISNTTFANLTTTSNSGGAAIYGENLISTNNIYYNNFVDKVSDGAVVVSGETVQFIGDKFISNKALGDNAALSISASDNQKVLIKDTIFKDNHADANGGAVALFGGDLINCTFENNTAGGNGGALYLEDYRDYDYNLPALTLTDVRFKNNNATNGKDIFIKPSSNSNNKIVKLPGMTVTFKDLSTKTLHDTVIAEVTHESGASIGGGIVTFFLDGSRIGESEVMNGYAEFSYLGFKDGTYVLSGSWNNAIEDTEFVNGTVTAKLSELDDNITLYVSDVNGNDETGDGSLAKPFKTINAALSKGYTKSQVIIVNLLEGNYTGLGNTNLTTFSSLDISIIGQGKNKTIINGENRDWFMKILAGMGGSIKLYNMTIIDMSTNYMPSRAIGTSAISIENGAELLVDGVEFIACHGNDGGAIKSEGTLTVLNSYFFNNGDSNYGGAIKSEGTLFIDNSEFIANHAKWGSSVYSTGELYFFNSIIQDSMRVNGMNGDTIALGGKGTVVVVNSTIFRSGKTSAELIGTGQTWANNPYFVVGVNGEYLKIINSTINGYDKTLSNAQYAPNIAISSSAGWGTSYRSPEVLQVYNSKFYNVAAVMVGTNGISEFDSCIFENITNFAQTANRITTATGNVTVVNSYIVDGTFKITKVAGTNFTFNDNWWGNNDQPTYVEANVDTHPDTWLILTLNTTEDGSAILAFKSSDGENITDFDGDVYAREFAIDAVNATLKVSNGTITNSVVIPLETGEGPGLYLNATLDGQSVNLTRLFTELSAKADPVHIGQNITVEITNPADLKNNITVIIDGKEYSSAVTGAKTIIIIPDLVVGNYTATVHYPGDDVYLAKSIAVYVKVIDIIIKASDVEKYYGGSEKLNVTVTDSEGAILANETVILRIAGETFETVTDSNGFASFDLNMSAGNYVAEISLNTTNVTANVLVKSTAPASVANGSKADSGFKTTFVGSNGKPLANTKVVFDVDGRKITKTTDANGVAQLTKDEIGGAGNHVITVTNPVTNETVKTVVTISKPTPAPAPVKPKTKIVLKANKKTIKIKKTTKKFTVKATLKINGKFVKGKVIKFKFKGKTYKAKTNKKGVAKVTIKKKVIKKLKKGKKYIIKISYGKKTAKTTVKVKK